MRRVLMRSADQPQRISVLLLGPENAGKTALIRNLKGEQQTEYCQTIGVDYRFHEDAQHTVKATFSDPSGSERFSFLRKELIKQPKNCIIIVVNNADANESLKAIKDAFDEIDSVYPVINRESEFYLNPPIGLIINNKIACDESIERALYAGIVEQYSFRFEFIYSCSV